MSLSGFTRSCGLQSSGIKYLHLIYAADLTSMTATQKVYTAITLESGKFWKKYEFDPDMCEVTEDVAMENGAVKYTHKVNFHMAKMGTSGRAMVEEISLAAACGLVGIAEDNNGTKWVLGYTENHLKSRPLLLESIKSTTGKKLTDASGYDIALACENNEPMYTETAAIVLS